MKKSSRASKTVMSGGMFMNSSSSNESNSDDDKCHLPTADLIYSENEKDNDEEQQQQQVVVIRRNTNKLKRQQATISLQSPLSIRNLSSLESFDNITNDENLLNYMTIKKNHSLTNNFDHEFNRTSFNESERTDSGIGRDSGSSWRLSNYSDSFHHSQQHHQIDKQHDSDSNNENDDDDDHDELTTGDADETLPISNINNDSQLLEDSLEDSKLQKAGWLHVKHWLTVQRHHKLELASKRQWKRFWIGLKGSNLCLYNDHLDNNPKLIISIIECLCYPLPEHPTRQHVFSLTTRTGDTYCLQASDQSELDQWIRNIHYCCCCLKTNENTLRTTIEQLEDSIERENKMRKLGDLQLKSTTNQKIRLLISKQIDLWEKNLENFHVDLFRHKCYLCALSNDRELPNPKDLLAQVCPTTKAALQKLTTFAPCSFYACVTARRRLERRKQETKLINTSINDEQRTKCYLSTPTNPIESLQTSTVADQTVLQMVVCDSNPQMRTIVSINEMTTVGELLKRVTDKLGLQIDDYFLCFDSTSLNSFVPNRNEKLSNLTYSSIDVRRKIVYQVTLNKTLELSGIEIATELHQESSLQVVVSDVKVNSESERLGVRKDDEIVIVNNSIVQDLDLDTLDRYFNKIPIILTLRSSRLSEENHDPNRTLDFSHSIIQNLICPPPPPRRIERLSRQELRELIVPKPDSTPSIELPSLTNKDSKENDPSSSALERLFKNVDELSRYCRPMTTISHTNIEQIHEPPRIKVLSNAQRLRKVIFELIETERSYVQDMQRLLERYIEPLRDDSKLLPADAIESLYVSVKSIHQLQQTFLSRLDTHIPTEILAYNALPEFREILISISETFLSYCQYFKLYSTFCAMHLRINRLLDLHQNNQHLKEFLAARNPRHQHSSSFQSYLIKPVQRILKYPLLLQQMLSYSTTTNNNENNSPDHSIAIESVKLKQAISMMNNIAEYMNRMQQLYEDFGQSFEHIIKVYSEEHNKSLQLNLPDLYVYGEIDWINIHSFVNKNHQRLKIFCFVFRNGCLLLVREQSNKKKQDLLSISKGNKILTDRFIRFIPIEEIRVEIIGNDESKDNIYTWQLIQTDSKTRLKTFFRFTNKDAQTFVNTINNCLSTTTTTVEWRQNLCERSKTTVRNSDPSYLLDKTKSKSPQRLSSSRSCHTMISTHSKSFYHQKSDTQQRSPSPIWKRRTTPIRRQPSSTNQRRHTLKNSTDC